MLKKITNYIRLRLGIVETVNRLKYVEQQFAFLAAYTNLTLPEQLAIDKAVLNNVLKDIKEKYQVEGFNTLIHKNDLMFAHHIFNNTADLQKGVYGYFRVGCSTAINLSKICNEYGVQPKSLLDFGSGYGRVSRFFPTVFPNSQITVSEVKNESLQFQKDALGYEGISHTQDPETLPNTKYDLIFALSVFTHLPERSFKAWLTKLTECLNPGGALIFTFNNVTTLKNKELHNKDFHYWPQSEDSAFSFIADSISNTADYGSTYASHALFKDFFEDKNCRMSLLLNKLVPNQESIIVFKE